jgi:hypothetical protein
MIKKGALVDKTKNQGLLHASEARSLIKKPVQHDKN